MSAAHILDVVQGTPEWEQARCGFVTASRCSDVIAMKQRGKGEKAERADYRAEIVSERLTHQPYPQHISRVRAVEWGNAQEGFAADAYEIERGVLVDTVGFVLHPSIAWFGCSPDRFVGDVGMLQIKCPDTRTHLEWLQRGTIPVEHAPQLLSELACNPEREWVDFMSFDPRLPRHLQTFIRRYERNDKLVAMVEAEVRHFNSEVEEVLAALPQKPQGAVLLMDQPYVDELEF